MQPADGGAAAGRAGVFRAVQRPGRRGRRHPDRDARFGYIAAQATGHLAGGQPVISVDAPKNEQAGGFARAGREWRPEGSPVAVRSRDFAGPQGGHAIPYGICDAGADTGFVNAGTGPDTAASAVESVRRWRELIGTGAYPDARRLLVTCDAGGASHWRNRAWKAGLAEFAQQAGLEITACHFPPGTRPAPASGTSAHDLAATPE